MGLFERTHLSDQNPSALCRGPSRGLLGSGLMESTFFSSSRPARKTAGKQQGGSLVHPETDCFWIELSAVSDQQSANLLMAFAGC